MHRPSQRFFMLFAAFTVVGLLSLVTSISSLAHSPASTSPAAAQQQITPTPSEADASVAGSTDGIVSMGIVIALIVLVPLLLSRAMWARQT